MKAIKIIHRYIKNDEIRDYIISLNKKHSSMAYIRRGTKDHYILDYEHVDVDDNVYDVGKVICYGIDAWHTKEGVIWWNTLTECISTDTRSGRCVYEWKHFEEWVDGFEDNIHKETLFGALELMKRTVAEEYNFWKAYNITSLACLMRIRHMCISIAKRDLKVDELIYFMMRNGRLPNVFDDFVT